MANREVVVLSAVRSAVGGFGGSLKDMEPSDLGAVVIKEAIARAGMTSFPSVLATRSEVLSMTKSAEKSGANGGR